MGRVALIDNATLTAAQRLLGGIEVKNLYNVDGDIAAFETLLQALLFFDEICCIDDYKEEFKRQRQQQFSFIRFLPEEEIEYAPLMQSAREVTEGIMLQVAGHEIDNSEIRAFFDMLKTHLVFNWRMSSSVFYLTVNLLADDSGVSVDKYSTLHAMIVSQMWGEASEPPIGQDIPLRDKAGRKLAPHFTRDKEFEIGAQVQTFAAALNWLALRTAFYSLVAESTDMDVVLHPIRHAFLANLIQRSYEMPSSTYHSVTKMLRDGITGTVREIVRMSDPILSELTLPMWSAYLAVRTKDPAQFLTECQHIREEGVFVEARSHLGELQQLNEDRKTGKYVTAVNKLNLDLSRVSARLLSKYGVSARQEVAVTPAINVLLKAKAGQSIPGGLANIPMPRALIGTSDRHGFRGLFRSVVSDLVSIERLGQIHKIITSNVRREQGRMKFPIHEENSRWLGRNASWKRWL